MIISYFTILVALFQFLIAYFFPEKYSSSMVPTLGKLLTVDFSVLTFLGILPHMCASDILFLAYATQENLCVCVDFFSNFWYTYPPIYSSI